MKNNYNAIYVSQGDYNLFTNLSIFSNSYGIYFVGTSGDKALSNNITKSYFNGNSLYDFYIQSNSNSNFLYQNYFNQASLIETSTNTNTYYKTIGSNYLGNFWQDPTACSNPSNYNYFIYEIYNEITQK